MDDFNSNYNSNNNGDINSQTFNSSYRSDYGNYNAPKPPKNGHSTAVVIIASVLAALIGAVSAVVGMAGIYSSRIFSESTNENGSLTNQSNVSINVDEDVNSVAQAVAAKCSNSVVGIRTTTSVQNFFFGQSSESTGEGSGVIYKKDGYIITNYHVISSAVEDGDSTRIDVFIGSTDSKPYEAKVIGYSISSDLAVIKIEADNLNAIEVGNSDDLSVGEYVVTIGSPGGLDFMGSVTYGIVSGLDRVVSTDSDVKLIQTDAAINPGNSGGALLSVEGKLIGINSSKIVSTEYEGMGFSIPVNTAVEKCDKIIARENEPESYIGITYSARYTEDVLKYYGYPSGAVVQSVDVGSPAETAQISRGDIITEIEGKSVSSVSEAEEIIRECELGSTVEIKFYRSGKYYTTKLKIASNS